MTWFLTVASLIGNYLNCRRKKICFIIWIAVNIGWLWYDLSTRVFSRAVLDSVQVLFSAFGYQQWARADKALKR